MPISAQFGKRCHQRHLISGLEHVAIEMGLLRLLILEANAIILILENI